MSSRGLRGLPIAEERKPPEGWTQGNPLERQCNEAVDFAIHSANTLIGLLPGGKGFLQGRTVLEIGAGQDFGFPLILIGLGARTVLVDKYLCDWDKHFHPPFTSVCEMLLSKSFQESIRQRLIR
jgi:hypothetical protein